MAQKIINKALTAVIFGSHPELLCKGSDLGSEMAQLKIDGEAATRIENAFGTTQSPNFYTQCTVTVNVLKTSEVCKEFIKQYQMCNILDGSVVFSFDNGEHLKLESPSIELSEINGDGSSSTIPVTIKGNMLTNQGLL